jgi:methionine synthase II (cobalamin-independent)
LGEIVRDHFKPEFLPISIGSLPHTDPEEACDLVLAHFPEVSAWPQLPKRSFLENMYVQFSAGFPGIVLEGERIYVDRAQDLTAELECLYLAYLENDLDSYAINSTYAAGLAQWSKSEFNSCKVVKGQVTGPISWGLSVVDQEKRPVLYDEVLADAAAKHLRLKAAWQERELRQLHPTTIILLDEPYMASFGSAHVAVTREQAIALMEEVLGGLKGLKGVHCCGNTDWSVVLSTSIDILSFDTYEYAESLSLYPAEVESFLRRGGIIVWGIVPREEEKLAYETTASLVERLHQAMELLVRKGICYDDLLAASLVSACCGLGSIPLEWAERALALAADVSKEMRKRYLLP